MLGKTISCKGSAVYTTSWRKRFQDYKSRRKEMTEMSKDAFNFTKPQWTDSEKKRLLFEFKVSITKNKQAKLPKLQIQVSDWLPPHLRSCLLYCHKSSSVKQLQMCWSTAINSCSVCSRASLNIRHIHISGPTRSSMRVLCRLEQHLLKLYYNNNDTSSSSSTRSNSYSWKPSPQ